MELSGQIIDLQERRIFPGRLVLCENRIAEVVEDLSVTEQTLLLPGFVDAHVHVESSMLPPAEFGRTAVRHGTVATVSDPHEIANVLGMAGVDFMLESAKHSPIPILFGAPSCVPATPFETAGAVLDADAVGALLSRAEIGYLSEVMNYPGVLARDPELMQKIAHAKAAGKPVDGHAPGLRGSDAADYAAAGITTDHECVALDEALDKIAAGMWIAIREGSAARNYEALAPLLRSHPDRCFFCTDDMHPNALVEGHIDRLVARAIADGYDLFDVLRVACVNPVGHYRLPVGQLRAGDFADFIRISDTRDFRVLETWLRGQRVAVNGQAVAVFHPSQMPNQFVSTPFSARDFAVETSAESVIVPVIEARDGQLITGAGEARLIAGEGVVLPDTASDVLTIAVVNRYQSAPPALAWIRGFGLQHGAIASSVAHDSHNIVAVGTSREAMASVVNAVMSARGGVAVCDASGAVDVLPLEIAGLMSADPADVVAGNYDRIAAKARTLGSPLRDPFMTLSFMALLVIPDLKLSDKGLFSGAVFEFVDGSRM